jgi:hypothetical protein
LTFWTRSRRTQHPDIPPDDQVPTPFRSLCVLPAGNSSSVSEPTKTGQTGDRRPVGRHPHNAAPLPSAASLVYLTSFGSRRAPAGSDPSVREWPPRIWSGWPTGPATPSSPTSCRGPTREIFPVPSPDRLTPCLAHAHAHPR